MGVGNHGSVCVGTRYTWRRKHNQDFVNFGRDLGWHEGQRPTQLLTEGR